jgi:hypothetical protein
MTRRGCESTLQRSLGIAFAGLPQPFLARYKVAVSELSNRSRNRMKTMHSISDKKSRTAIFLAALALAFTSTALAQGSEKPLSAEEIENKVKQQWKNDAKDCDKASKTQIARVDIISSEQYKTFITKHHMANDDAAKVVPNAHYVKVASLSQSSDDGIFAYGPVDSTAKSTEFKNLVGMHICNQNVHGK